MYLLLLMRFCLLYRFTAQLIEQAEKWAFQSTGVQVILCTCAVAAKSSIIKSCRDNIKQCIVDECGMCMELESLLPIAFLAPQQVVLIGDHKQLQPVIHDKKAQNLGLQVSMFERLSGQAKMLQLQYRMVNYNRLWFELYMLRLIIPNEIVPQYFAMVYREYLKIVLIFCVIMNPETHRFIEEGQITRGCNIY